MTPFYTILTNYGKTALASALAAQQPLKIPHMAVGDGGGEYYEPVEEQTNLRNERWRGDLNDLRTDDELQGQVIAEAIIPHDIEDGDWTAREIGLFDAKGGLVAVGKYPETYIPAALSGAKSQVYINIIIKVDNVAAVALIVDHDTVLASKLYVGDTFGQLKEPDGASHVGWRGKELGEILDRTVYSSDFKSLEEFAAFPAAVKVFEEGIYSLQAPLTFDDDVLKEFKTSGKVTLNCSSPMVAVTIGSQKMQNVGVTQAISKGSSELYFQSMDISVIDVGDIIFIHNPTDFSFSPHRNYYRQGESVKVKHISQSKITIEGAVIDSYPIGCKVIKPTMRKMKTSGEIEVNFPVEIGQHQYSAKSLGVLLSQLRSTDTSGFSVKVNQGAYAIIARHCIDCSGVAMTGIQSLQDAPTLGLDYGINLANCQNVNFQGYFLGERHGACTSGSGYIINRFCTITGEIRTTSRGQQSAADWHGNSEFCLYGGYMQGLTFGGDLNSLVRGSIVDGFATEANRPTVMGAELLGISFDFSGVHLYHYGAPHSRYYGVLDIGGNTNELSATTRRGGKLILDDMVITAPLAEQTIKLRNRGSIHDLYLSADNLMISSLPQSRPIEVSAISGVEFKEISISKPSLPKGSEVIIKRQTGGVGITKTGLFNATIPAGRSEVTVNVPTGDDIFIDTPLFTSAVVNSIQAGDNHYSFIASVTSANSQRLVIRIKSTAGGLVSSDTVLSCSYLCYY